MSRFDEFWNDAWPANGKPPFKSYTRKVNRKKCAEKWDALGLDSQADVILADVRKRVYDKGWLASQGKYICAPLVYLGNERWLDNAGMADIRDRDEKTESAGTGMAFPEVRRGVYSLIRLGYDDESILNTFDITGTDLYDAKKKVESIEGAKF